jgi:hypothetical protein
MRSALMASYNSCGDLSVSGKALGATRNHNAKQIVPTLMQEV